MEFLVFLFRTVLSLSLAGGAAVCLTLGAKALLKNRPGPRWNYYIWGVPLFLFLAPLRFSLPQWHGSAGSSGNAAGSAAGAILAAGGPAGAGAAAQPALEPAVLEQAAGFLRQALPVLAWAWILGVFFTAAVRLVDYRSLRRSLDRCSCAPDPQGKTQGVFSASLARQGISPKRVGLLICPGVESPLLLGIIHPKVVLPREDYPKKQLEMIFSHELTHYRYRDLWLKALAVAASCIHWFNPLARVLLRDLSGSCEVLCDERTTGGMGPGGRRQYGRMLLQVAREGQRMPKEGAIPISQPATLALEKGDLKRRLLLLREKKATTLLDRAVGLALALTVAAAGAVCSSAANPGPVFQSLFAGKNPASPVSETEEEVPDLWEKAQPPDSIPQPNPSDLRQPVLQMQAVRASEVQAAADEAEEEKSDPESVRQAPQGISAEEDPGEKPAAATMSPPQADGEMDESAPEGGPLEGEADRGDAGDAEAWGDLSWDGSFLWPVEGGYISCGMYGYYGHDGVDIAADEGTKIYAAADGVVTYAGTVSVWPYGKSVLLSHGDSVETRYAHCSKVLVEEGEYVEQGDLIALVGRTGNATGSHCHFEVIIGGSVKNPTSYIGSQAPA